MRDTVSSAFLDSPPAAHGGVSFFAQRGAGFARFLQLVYAGPRWERSTLGSEARGGRCCREIPLPTPSAHQLY